MVKTRMRESYGDRVFSVINGAVVLFIVILTAYPLYFTIIASISDPYSVVTGKVYFWPKGFTLEAYTNIIKESQIWIGYRNTIFYTVCGTIFNLFLTITSAYVLSKSYLPGRKVINWVYLIVMYFSGGLVPTYMLVKSLNLIDTPYVLILIGGINIYNMIVTRSYYSMSIPKELYEAANIDGCGEWAAFVRIAIPLSFPIIAVMSLYYGVAHWNSYFHALIYTSSRKLQPLQLVLRNILILNQDSFDIEESSSAEDIAFMARRAYLVQTMKYALIFIASAPVIAMYPIVQKFFIKGVMIGSIKG